MVPATSHIMLFFKVHTLIFKHFYSNDALRQQEGKQHQVTDAILFHSTFTPVVQHQTTTLLSKQFFILN